jgi:Mrp family chromosome partitioning ATPase/capsular polysaccharide biosynthesis protein
VGLSDTDIKGKKKRMAFTQYWTILIKRWRLIVICIVVVGLGVFIGSKLLIPLYQSSTLVEVTLRSSSNQSADYNSVLASDQFVQTASLLAVSDPVLREVASHYPNLTADQLLKEVTSTPKVNTQLFQIDVLDSSATRAAELANDIATTLIKQQLQVIQQDNRQSQQQVQQDLSATRQQIDTITAQISAAQVKGGNQQKVAVLQAQLSGLQQHYAQWQTLLAQLNLVEAQSGNIIRIAQPAQPGLKPVRPNMLLNTSSGLLAGLLLGMLLAVLFEQLDTRVRTPEALNDLLGWSMLGTVWQVDSSKKESVLNPTGNSANVESYRILRTNIGFSGIDKPLRSLVVTSALPNDGKSTIAANLAIFMAKAGKTTLLVDADLRHSSVHEEFGLSGEKMGLTNAVLAFNMQGVPASPSNYQFHSTTLQAADTLPPINLSLKPFIHSVGIPNLWVMPAGPLPPNPPELLDSKAMGRLSLALANCGAEIVIFDTPPLLGLSDTSILASKMDGTLVVADITRAKKGNLKQVKAILEQSGASVLGYVVNKQRRSRKDNANSYYYYYRNEDPRSEGKHSVKNGNVPDVPANGSAVFHTDQPTGPLSSFSPSRQQMSSTDSERGS